ncbi:MAG: insulinase family protein [Chitinophagaceae bacterium]|nr:insulinase family protein [Chitinophagaceae bacterium]
MNKKIILSIASFSLLTTSLFAQTLDRSIRPKAGPAPVLQMGSAQSFISSNGIKVYVVENHKLPVVSYTIDFDIQPELQGDMVGFQDFVGDLITSGTKNKSKDQFNAELDQLGARLSVGSDGIYMQSLKKNSDKLLALASEVLTEPKFSEAELKKLKTQAKSGLAQQQDDPEAMSSNITSILNFGKKHPYGEIMTEASIEKITLERCQKFFETYFRPNVAYMAIVGDITLAEAKLQVEKNFATWQKKEVPRATYPTPASPKGASVAVVNKTGAVQSVIDVTYPINMKPGDADEIKLKVANGILGGGSTGRLFLNLRETHAWTYGSYSSFRTDELPNAGSFSATANSTTNASDSSVAEILKEMELLRTQPVSEESLQGYKNFMSGTFALGLEDPKTLARYAINEKKYNMPKDYYKNYLKNVEAVTAQDVMTVAKKYITPGVANITVAGDKKQVVDKLKKFGPVTVYDIYGNVEVDEPAKALPANLSAQDVVKKHIQATGGEAAWKKITDMTLVMQMEMQGMKIDIKTIHKTPNKMMLDVNMMGNSLQKIVFDGTKGYMSQQGQKKDMDAKEVAEYSEEASMHKELDYLNGKYKLALKGIEKVDGSDAYQVEVTKASGDIVTEYFDVNSGLKVRTDETEESEEGKSVSTTFYKDYKDGPGGLKYPNSIKQVGGPMGALEMTMKSVEVNTNVSEEVFK